MGKNELLIHISIDFKPRTEHKEKETLQSPTWRVTGLLFP